MDSGETRKHQRDKTPCWCHGEHATTGADQTLGPRPVTLSSEGRPLLAVSGSARSVVACSLDCGWSLDIAGVHRTGACSRLSPPVPGPRGGRGHTCRTPPQACSVGNATSPSVQCQAGTHAAYPGPQMLRHMRCWLFSHIRGRRAATTP